MRIKFFFVAVSLLILGSCKKGNSEIPNFHFDYFPLEEGTYVIYDAMEIRHDIQALVARDTNRFFLKTVIGESIIDNSGNTAHKFFRYKRKSMNENWVLADVWTTRLHDRRIELVEENERIVKLVFAPTRSKVWDINAYNTKNRQLARYNPERIHVPFSVSDYGLDSTVQVEIQDFFSLVDHRRKYEVYAKGIGLVHRFYKDNSIMNFDTLNIRDGREIHYRMIDFGKE